MTRHTRRTILKSSFATGLGISGIRLLGTGESQENDRIQWSFETSYGVDSSPTIVDGTVFIGTTDAIDSDIEESVYALDASSGQEIWSFSTGQQVFSSPVVADGTVFVGSWDNYLYALDAIDGGEVWSFNTGAKINCSPTVADGTVVIGNNNGDVYALDAASGNDLWVFEADAIDQLQATQTGANGISSPTIANGAVFIMSANGVLYALDLSTGDKIWSVNFDELRAPSASRGSKTVLSTDREDHVYISAVDNEMRISPFQQALSFPASPTVVGSTVFAVSQGTIYAVEANDGEVLWSVDISGSANNSAGNEEVSFLGHSDRHRGVKSDRTDATPLQVVSFGQPSPTVFDGTVFVVGEADIYALGADSGDEIWSVGLDSRANSSPTVADGTVFVGTAMGTVYALRTATGEAIWTFDIGNGSFSSPTVVDGSLFIGSSDSLYALNAGIKGSSEGSRVRLRTLGHHDIAIQGGDGSVEDHSETEGFDPTTHGFGFENYDTPAPPEWTDLFNIVGDFVDELQETEVFGPTVGPLKRLALTGLIYSGLKGAWTNGHCLGMVLTAREYYETEFPELPGYSPDVNEDEWPLPLAVPPETAADITEKPRTKPELDPIESDIDLYQHRQSFDSSYTLRYVATAAVENNDLDLINYEAVIEATQEQLSDGVPALLGLIDNIDSGHAVLAYDIELENINEPVQSVTDATRVDVSVYDPNSSAVNYYDRDPYFITFSRPSTQDEFQMATYSSGNLEYSEAMFVEEVDPDYEFFAGEEAADAYAVALSEGVNNYLSVGVMSPVTVEITGPGETTLRRLDVDSEQLLAETKYETVYYAMDIDPGEYDIELTGTGTGEYTIEVEGETTKGGTIAESYTGRITEDETQNLTVMLPTESDQIGQLQAEEPSTDADTDDNSLLFGLSETEIATGGIVSVAMLYGAVRMMSDDGKAESDEKRGES